MGGGKIASVQGSGTGSCRGSGTGSCRGSGGADQSDRRQQRDGAYQLLFDLRLANAQNRGDISLCSSAKGGLSEGSSTWIGYWSARGPSSHKGGLQIGPATLSKPPAAASNEGM